MDSEYFDLEEKFQKADRLINKGNNEYGIMKELQGNFTDAIHYYKLYIRNNFDNKGIETATESIKRC